MIRGGAIASVGRGTRYALARRLRASGVGFRELVDETRFEIASQMLEGSQMDVSEIAAAFEYSNASAFTRAFRRWIGTTPVLWRSERRHRR
jgi:AraC-like DNA-binding protein